MQITVEATQFEQNFLKRAIKRGWESLRPVTLWTF